MILRCLNNECTLSYFKIGFVNYMKNIFTKQREYFTQYFTLHEVCATQIRSLYRLPEPVERQEKYFPSWLTGRAQKHVDKLSLRNSIMLMIISRELIVHPEPSSISRGPEFNRLLAFNSIFTLVSRTSDIRVKFRKAGLLSLNHSIHVNRILNQCPSLSYI